MKITTPSGIVIELADGETIPTDVMDRIMGSMTASATVVRSHRSSTTPAVVATTPAYLPMDEFIKESQAIVAAAPRKRRPIKCYLTATEFKAMNVMLNHPEGLTTERLAKILNVTHSAASSTLHRIRTKRPYKDTTEPLVVAVSKHVHKVTMLGARLTYVVADGRSSPKKNRDLGWGA